MALGCALSACGGGSGSADTGTATQTQPKPVVIDAEGDSIMWGYLGATSPSNYIQSVNNPPDVMQAELQTQFGDTVTVQNNAVPGAQLAQSLAGTVHYSVPFATRLAASPAKIVIMEFAVNDSIAFTVDQYTANLQTWVNDVRAAGKQPVLEEPNPVCTPGYTNVEEFSLAMDGVATSMGVPLVAQYDYIAAMPDWQNMLVDCMHPNDALYKIKAKREVEVLAPIVSALVRS